MRKKAFFLILMLMFSNFTILPNKLHCIVTGILSIGLVWNMWNQYFLKKSNENLELIIPEANDIRIRLARLEILTELDPKTPSFLSSLLLFGFGKEKLYSRRMGFEVAINDLNKRLSFLEKDEGPPNIGRSNSENALGTL